MSDTITDADCPHEHTFTNLHGDEECGDCGEINIVEDEGGTG